MRAAVIAALLWCSANAFADRHRIASGDGDASASPAPSDPDQLVLVNATTKIGDLGQLSRIRHALDQRGMLFRLPESLEATLDQRNVLVADLEAIKEAYSNLDFDNALKLVQADETRILENAAAGDPVPALAELSQWRGIIAAAVNQPDESLKWFRAAVRFNPAWVIDKKLASPRVRAIVKKAKREATETGSLRVEADPDDATLLIDGGAPRNPHDKVELPIGIHLVMLTAPQRAPYAELVDIQQDQLQRIPISLDKESKLDRAARLVDETAAAPPGKARLKRAKALLPFTRVPRMLVVEDGGDDHVIVRVYDVSTKKVSKQLDFEGAASSAEIASKIKAALDPDQLFDVNTVIIERGGGRQEFKWYQRWYVWVGAAAVLGGGIVSYEYMTREPTQIRGF